VSCGTKSGTYIFSKWRRARHRDRKVASLRGGEGGGGKRPGGNHESILRDREIKKRGEKDDEIK